MIITGGGRGNVGFWSGHLLRDDTNERAEVKEISGVLATDLEGALREMELVASGSRSQGNFMYVAAFNPEPHEVLTEAQWIEAVEIFEEMMRLQGHQRVVVEHEKDGRVHRHVVWNRVDENLRVCDIGGNYYTHQRVAREIEERFGLERTPSFHGQEYDGGPRPPRAPELKDYEIAEKAGTTPQDMRALVKELRQQSDTPEAFRAALDEAGYLLANGKRPFLVVDPAGEPHSLPKLLNQKKAEVEAFIGDMELMPLDAAKAVQAERQQRRELEAEQTQATPEPKQAEPEKAPAVTPAPALPAPSPQARPPEAIAAEVLKAESEIGLPPGKPMETIQAVYPGVEKAEPVAPPPPPSKSWRELKDLERTAQLTEAWHEAQTPEAFCMAVNDAGYVLAHGDHGNLIVVDRRGYPASLAKSLDGIDSRTVRGWLEPLKPDLPDLHEAKAMQQARGNEPLRQMPVAAEEQEQTPRPTPAAAKQPSVSQSPPAVDPAHRTERVRPVDPVQQEAIPIRPEPPIRRQVESQQPPAVDPAYKTERVRPATPVQQEKAKERPVSQPPPAVDAAYKVERIRPAAPVQPEVTKQPPVQRPPTVDPAHRVERVRSAAPVQEATPVQPEAMKEPPVQQPPAVDFAYKVERVAPATRHTEEVRPFSGTERQVIQALREMTSGKDFVGRLAEMDLKLAMPTPEEVESSTAEAIRALQDKHRPSLPFAEKEIVVVNKLGNVTRLSPEMVEGGQAMLDQKLAQVDRARLGGVAYTKDAQMQEAQKASSMNRDAEIATTPTVARAHVPSPVAVAKVGLKVLDGATGALTGILDFLSGTPKPPPPRDQVEQRQRIKAGIAALKRVIEAAEQGETLKAEDVQRLPQQAKDTLLKFGDTGMDMLRDQAKYFERRSRGRD